MTIGDGAMTADARALPLEMPIEEARHLLKSLLRFRRGVVEEILRVRLAFIDMESRFDAELTEFPVDAHRVAQEQIPRSAGQNRRGKSAQIAIDREISGSPRS
jgi:hypothetical protein